MTTAHDKPLAWLKAAMGGQFDPFPWQRRLLRQLIAGDPPRALGLPTGLGMASMVAICRVPTPPLGTHRDLVSEMFDKFAVPVLHRHVPDSADR